jgi:hypothetical protein
MGNFHCVKTNPNKIAQRVYAVFALLILTSLPYIVNEASANVITSVIKDAAEGAARSAAVKAAAQGASQARPTENQGADALISLHKYFIFESTKGFERRFLNDFKGYTQINGKKVPLQLSMDGSRGDYLNKFGKNWVRVHRAVSGKNDNEPISFSLTLLFDPSSKMLVHIISNEDGGITSYEWEKIPRMVKVDNLFRAGKVLEKDSAGKTVSSGTVDFLIKRIGSNVQFCQIENTRSHVEKNSVSKSTECNLFQTDGQPISSSVEIILDQSVITAAEGPFIVLNK